MEIYESIGHGYVDSRRPEPRWVAAIERALGGARSVINVGAGTGSYEPGDGVVAVEPAMRMIRQRPPSAAPVVCARAEGLPFANDTFEAALAVLTTHHWSDVALGLSEMTRVASRQVIVTWDPQVFAASFWLLRDYLPEIAEHDFALPTLAAVTESFPKARAEPLPVPHDCVDGFLGAFWRRPDAYLDPEIRSSMSGFALIDQRRVDAAMAQLAVDLESGEWARVNADLLELKALDLGYRLVTAKREH